MQRTVSIEKARQRAKIHHVENAPNLTTQLALCAYDIVTDEFPENDVKLIGNARAAMARGEFEFIIQ